MSQEQDVLAKLKEKGITDLNACVRMVAAQKSKIKPDDKSIAWDWYVFIKKE